LKTYLVSHAGGQAKNKKAHTLTLRYELFLKIKHPSKKNVKCEPICLHSPATFFILANLPSGLAAKLQKHPGNHF